MTTSLKIGERIAATLNDPAASFWLKEALHTALSRDPVDAANDADFLAMLLQQRLDAVTNGEDPDGDKESA